MKTCASRTSTARRSSNPDDPLYVEETSKPFVRELCGNAFQKTPVTTERRARGCASFCGFYRSESVAVGAWRGLITQRSLVQIQPPQPSKVSKPKGSAEMIGRPLWPSMK